MSKNSFSSTQPLNSGFEGQLLPRGLLHLELLPSSFLPPTYFWGFNHPILIIRSILVSKNSSYSAQTFFEGFKAQLLPLSTLSPWYHAPTSFLGLHFYQAEYLVCHGSVHKLDSFNSSVFLNFLDTPLHPLIVSLNTVSARRGKIGLRERITIILNNNNILILVI